MAFETIVFSFNKRSVENLARIASNERTAKHVRALVLWRGPMLGLRGFKSFKEWEKCLRFSNRDKTRDENGTDDKGYPSDRLSNEESNDSHLICDRDWSKLTYNKRSALYRDYNEERIMKSAFREDLIKKVKDSLEKLIKLSELIHDPVIEEESEWDTRWKKLQFDHYRLISPVYDSWKKEHDVDALHLACLLLALGRIEKYPINLKSFTFYVEGPAFWGTNRLRHLFQDYDHDKIRKLRRLHDHAEQADLIADEDFGDDIESNDYVTQLASMGKIVQRLTHIDCYVCDKDSNGGLSTTAEPLLRFLCGGENLERVSLVYGDFANKDTESYDSLSYYYESRPILLSALANQKPWPRITKLKLSIATNSSTLLKFLGSLAPTLRHLVLEEVTLIPTEGLTEGEEVLWEIALPRIASSLQNLVELELSFLQDFSSRECDQIARKLCNPWVEEWQGKGGCFDYYVHAVVDDLLRTQELQHPLDPGAFMEEHESDCKHEKTFEVSSIILSRQRYS
ncbi:hypothetical protein Alg130_10103 [Pyrenophora tritici-repentis]|nr:hypothetical protein Alg130_10103 [Pyrenophora tritici-repentis]